MSDNEALDILDEWITDWRGYSETCKAWEDRRTALALAIEALREKNDREKKSKEIPFITVSKYV